MPQPSWLFHPVLVGLCMLASSGRGLGQEKVDHPIVAGFERFHAKGGTADPIRGGQLLLAELNCLSCHRPEQASKDVVAPRQAPILDGVGGRVQRSFLRKLIDDPHKAKPGTTMPAVLAGLSKEERTPLVEALVHFLASTGTLPQERPQAGLVNPGKDLYHKVGCVACHGSRDAKGLPAKTSPSTVPLPDLKSKYSLVSLKVFLEQPHQTRPSARMPGLLDGKEAQQVANYLLQGLEVPSLPPNLNYAYYEGSWQKLPDFAQLKPVTTGKAGDFDVTLAKRSNDMALKFEGYLRIDRPGTYQFHLHSDDGSKLFIDDKLIVDNDGVHPPSSKSGSVKLQAGMHKLRAGVFNAGGGVELKIEFEGTGLGRQSIIPYVFLTSEGKPAPATADPDSFAVQPELVDKGRELFASLGCASCHQLSSNGKKLEARQTAPALAKLQEGKGCLNQSPRKGVPWFALNDPQRGALQRALKSPASSTTPADLMARTLLTFNCYACHERDKIGGVEEVLNPFFTTVQPEMGDEGRIPPSLTGAGAKLTATYLKQIFDQGAHDRPYMHTRMPKFGNGNVGHLVALWSEQDHLAKTADVTFTETMPKVKSAARHMVGGQAFGCIKCHTFAGIKSEGVQGIDMAIMTQRLQRDWFHQYLLNPNKFRQGTRMPTAWPEGKSFYPKILGGDTSKQIEAIWVYLNDGKKASIPIGMNKQFMPLVPDKEAIIYRNFIDGSGPRSIAVGFPEKAHLSFDANNLRIALIWHGGFIDASRHWTGRGEGFQPPLGDDVLRLPGTVSFAYLAKPTDPWPGKTAGELGYRFNGYRLSDDQRPTFLYSLGEVDVEDTPNAVEGKVVGNLRRTLVLSGKAEGPSLWFQAGAGKKIESLGDGWYRVDGELKVRLETTVTPEIRNGSGGMQLLVPVRFENGKARIVQEYVW